MRVFKINDLPEKPLHGASVNSAMSHITVTLAGGQSIH